MLGKSFLLFICLLLLEGCRQPILEGNGYVNCNSSSNVAPYSLESLDRDYECKQAQGEYR